MARSVLACSNKANFIAIAKWCQDILIKGLFMLLREHYGLWEILLVILCLTFFVSNRFLLRIACMFKQFCFKYSHSKIKPSEEQLLQTHNC